MKSHLSGPPSDWNYIDRAPKGVKLTLLTIGNIQVTGEWSDDGRFKAWAPLLRRNKVLEKELGIL